MSLFTLPIGQKLYLFLFELKFQVFFMTKAVSSRTFLFLSLIYDENVSIFYSIYLKCKKTPKIITLNYRKKYVENGWPSFLQS